MWGGLPESPWVGAMPTLTAAAMVTSTIRLGTLVAAPNFRHPVAFHREVQALDDISAGRFLLGVGTGGDVDSGSWATPTLTVKERVDRFQEFTDLLVRLRTEDHVSSTAGGSRLPTPAPCRQCATYRCSSPATGRGRCATPRAPATAG